MATPTYDPIASTTLASSASSVTFSSIPQTYRDLVLVVKGIPTTSTIIGWLQFNGDTSANYNWVRMFGNGSSASSSAVTNTNLELVVARSADNGHGVANIFDYSATDKHKSVLVRLDDPSSTTRAYAARWPNTSAITSVTISASNDQWAAGSTFSLFGIAA